MPSIRKSFYAVLLAVAALPFAPALASAQQAQGEFTLPHEVRWQNATVPAGDYKFVFESQGAMGVLTLSKLSGMRTGFVFLVSDTDDDKPTDLSQLVLETANAGTYVSTMKLPELGVVLRFAPPEKTSGKPVAKSGTSTSMSGQ